MTVLVAMSGGVDSSVAAALLHKGGHQVIGATMKTFCYSGTGAGSGSSSGAAAGTVGGRSKPLLGSAGTLTSCSSASAASTEITPQPRIDRICRRPLATP